MTLTLTPSNGYNQATTLTCTSASAGSTWSISPTSLKPSSAAPVTATVTLQTSTSSADLRSGKRDELLEAALPFGLATGLFLFAAQNSLRKNTCHSRSWESRCSPLSPDLQAAPAERRTQRPRQLPLNLPSRQRAALSFTPPPGQSPSSKQC